MYQTIIMPVDVFEMELSDKAVRHAEFLAQQAGVIHLLHVLPGSASLSLHRFAADVRRFEEHLQHEAETRLQTMVGHFSIDPSRIKTHVRFGSVRDAVNELAGELNADVVDRKSTRLNSSHVKISYAVFCLKKKKTRYEHSTR